ncbi:hypothetical protein IWX49DRAFT_204073 [Phyllosticta citricarpa]|uniref:SH3 domain-containing protein n=1 Tax=Phyllosticta paracitricarpa TaxID=2016321 RepID=A0ABR1N3R8_9PEZI
MPPAAPALPTKFPCWCKATYSWGGETKRDLGFIEGDLIECLNAGDGAWWMGRLKRNKHAVGLFPSNFVEVLDESLWPGNSRNTTPLAMSRNGSNNMAPPKQIPQKQKSMFRKPFTAYYNAGSPNPAAAARERLEKSGSGSLSSDRTDSLKKHRPYSSMKHATPPGHSPNPSPRGSNDTLSKIRGVSPAPERTGSSLRPSRATSPLPPRRGSSQYRAVSPAPRSRAVSPAPPQSYRAVSPAPQMYRTVSPAPPSTYRAVSPAPPSTYRAVSPAPPRNLRAISPAPPSTFRAVSPDPQQHRPISRAVSPAPNQFYAPSPALSPGPQQQYRAYSPVPDLQHDSFRPVSRGRSPAPLETQVGEESPPPPPPPPHRSRFTTSRVPSPEATTREPIRNGFRTPEPREDPRTRPGANLTPSPLTNAMNDVQSLLKDMGDSRAESPSPTKYKGISAWDQFGEVLTPKNKRRPVTSMGFDAEDEGHANGRSEGFLARSNSFAPTPESPPQVGNYLQRMEEHLQNMQSLSTGPKDELFFPSANDAPPAPPPKNNLADDRPQTSHGAERSTSFFQARPQSSMGGLKLESKPSLKHRKSAYEIARQGLGRTFTNKTTVTNASSNATNSTDTSNSTSHTLWSGTSLGGVSMTSAGSFARRKWGIGGSIREKDRERSKSVADVSRTRMDSGMGLSDNRPETPFTGVSYHSSHATQQPIDNSGEPGGLLGGLTSPKPRKSNFFKRMVESAKTGAASARQTISSSPSRPVSRASVMPNGVTAIAGGTAAPSPTRDMGLGTSDWVQVRRDVNRSNSLSKNERIERAERCQMNDIPVINPIEVLEDTMEGDENLDGLAVESPTDFTQCNLANVDKNTRFIQGLPVMTTPASLAQGFVCRPYRSEVQRLRAIFTWVSERITWEEDFEGSVNTRRVIQTLRGTTQEVATLVAEMCAAAGIHAEVVRGYLKAPGEVLDFDLVAHPNHWWNAVIVDGEWRIMDCSLASPKNPKRSAYSSAPSTQAEGGFFLARPSQICFTHVPLLPEQQHIVPPLEHEVLMALPCACPAHFHHQVEIVDFDTSLLNLEKLEMAHIHFFVPEDVEALAEVEARVLERDRDGDLFENGDTCTKKALCQPEWIGGRKRYTVKALLPGDEGQATLKVYVGKRGLRHSIKSNPHALAFALPLNHTGENPPYEFLTLHPTPHAQRHDLYVAQPQCARLAINNTFVFTVRQHPASTGSYFNANPAYGHHASASAGSNLTPMSGRVSPLPFTRPTSALSMVSASASNAGSIFSASSSSSDPKTQTYSSNGASAGIGSSSSGSSKPAKLAVQSPSGKILRLVRKSEHMLSCSTGAGVGGAREGEREGGDGSVWETVIKVGERGVWRGLVLADRSARWCVFAEWECF